MSKMKKNILFLFPNTANEAIISRAMVILGGIAQEHDWNIAYFDTVNYQKTQDTLAARESSGEFKPGFTKTEMGMLPSERLLPDLQFKIDEFKPDVLATTGYSLEFQYLMSFLSRVVFTEKTLLIIGGIHSTLRPDEVIGTGIFDLVCVGEGEGTFDEILTCLEEGECLTDIEGTYFRNKKTGEIIRNPRRRLMDPEELWNVPREYSFLDDRYFCYPFDGRIVRKFDLEVARGCPYDCAYCGNIALKKANEGLGKYIRTRPLDSIFYHLRRMVEEYNIEMFFLMDECFLSHSTSWLKEFSERYAANIRKPFIVQTRSETLTEERINILMSFGAPFFQVSIGVESGSEKILRDVCERKTTVKDIIRAFDLLHKYRIRNGAYFMVGFPFETRDDIFKSIELCRRINPTVTSVNIFQPLPGTKLFDLCIEKGYITGRETLVMFTDRSLLRMPQLSSEEIVNLRRTFMLYATLPKNYYPEIEKCELDFAANKQLFEELVKLRWDYDNPTLLMKSKVINISQHKTCRTE